MGDETEETGGKNKIKRHNGTKREIVDRGKAQRRARRNRTERREKKDGAVEGAVIQEIAQLACAFNYARTRTMTMWGRSGYRERNASGFIGNSNTSPSFGDAIASEDASAQGARWEG